MPERKIQVNIEAKNLAGPAFAQLNQQLGALGNKAEDTSKKVETVGGRLQSFGGALQGFGNKMSLFATAPLLALGTASVDAASDLAESQSKMQVVFGESQAVIQQFADSASRNLGMSTQTALEATSTFGNLFVSMGMGQQPAADMSMGLVQLAADLASFNNIRPEEALEKLRAGLVGETEPLRTLGVNLNADAIEAEAVRMGILGANDELTAGIKAQAAYSLILQQTKTAQGDFARTSDGLANSERIARAEMANVSAELGQVMLPIALEATHGLNGLLQGFQSLSPEMQQAAVYGGGFLAAVGPLSSAVGSAASVIGTLTNALTSQAAASVASKVAMVASTAAHAALTAAQWALNAAMTANPIGLVVVGLAALAAGLVWAYQNCEPFRQAVDAIFAVLRDVGGKVLDAIGAGLKGLGDLFGTLGESIGTMATDAQSTLQALLTWLQALPQSFLDAATSMGQNLVSGITSGLAGLGANLQQMFSDAVAGIKVDLGPFHLSAAGFTVDAPQMPSIGLPTIPSYDVGGVVPGRPGQPQLGVLHGGEIVTAPGQTLPAEWARMMISPPSTTVAVADPQLRMMTEAWQEMTQRETQAFRFSAQNVADSVAEAVSRPSSVQEGVAEALEGFRRLTERPTGAVSAVAAYAPAASGYTPNPAAYAAGVPSAWVGGIPPAFNMPGAAAVDYDLLTQAVVQGVQSAGVQVIMVQGLTAEQLAVVEKLVRSGDVQGALRELGVN